MIQLKGTEVAQQYKVIGSCLPIASKTSNSTPFKNLFGFKESKIRTTAKIPTQISVVLHPVLLLKYASLQMPSFIYLLCQDSGLMTPPTYV